METFVISLRRTPERYEQFAQNNARHRRIVRVDAVDGKMRSLDDLREGGLVAGPLAYTAGAIGNALSHHQLWVYAAEKGVPVTICEDDAFLHDDFATEQEKLLRRLGDDWDVVLWGWNFDSVLLAAPETNLSPFLMQFRQDEMRANKLGYLSAPAHPTLLRLQAAFGSMCYSISPAGAMAYLEYCFPLRPLTVAIPEINFQMSNVALDATMCSFYRKSRSWVCFPPLAVTDNDHSVSTVQPN